MSEKLGVDLNGGSASSASPAVQSMRESIMNGINGGQADIDHERLDRAVHAEPDEH
jgi:hypothetical protein